MTPESLAAPDIVKLTGDVPSVRRTTAFVVHPAGAVFACTCTRVTVTPLSGVHVAPVHVAVNAPERKMFCSPRGAAVRLHLPRRSLYVESPPAETSVDPAWLKDGVCEAQKYG